MRNQTDLNRMKSLMNYGLQTENKKSFASLEYSKVGADGKTYGIVREGTKYYIKVADKTKNVLKEDYNYIGGFCNRKNHEYASFANAQKNFDMKLRSINEACGKDKSVIAESWNPDKQAFMMVEATDSMKNEIARMRQIMSNSVILEAKKDSCCGEGCKCGNEGAKKGEYNMGTGDVKDCVFDETPKNSKEVDMEGGVDVQQNNIKEAAEPLAWHKEGGDAQETIADTYMDKSHGTSIGDSAPFDKGKGTTEEMHNGTVEEGTSMAMNCGDNQNEPGVGVGEVGDDAPFDTKAKNDLQEAEDFDGEDTEADTAEPIEDEPLGDEEEIDMDTETEDEPMEDFETEDLDDDEDFDLGDEDGEGIDDEEGFDDGLSSDNSRLTAIEDDINTLKDMLANISDKLGISAEETADAEFADDSLYDDDEEDDTDIDIEMDNDMDDDIEDDELGNEDYEDEEPEEDFEDEDDDEEVVYESRSYRRARINEENRLNDFGKHPAYQKKVMTLPRNGEDQNAHGRDWNDESVHGEQPFGQKIGSTAPFDIDPATITNSIAESIQRVLKKYNGRK